jgi:NAD(P)-dependent dehydrogenase (short-subunit alcohol dehydrogenase family)
VQGKVVVITGASRGIGAAAAREFAAVGAQVVLLARSASQVQDLAIEIGAGAVGLTCDVADWSQMQPAIAQVMARFGRVDVLINNAGVNDPIARLEDADVAAWGRGVDINLKGVFHGIRAVLPVMKAQRAGTIITLSSGAARTAYEGWSSYCAAKAGALMLTQALHLEEAAHGIRALGLSPGTVATDMQRVIKASGINPVSQMDFAQHIPPEWPAKCLVWMCGSAADDYLGGDVMLRDEAVRRAVGLIK